MPMATYRMPAAPLVLATVVLGCAGILAQMTAPQAIAIALSLGAGFVLFAAQRWSRNGLARRTADPPADSG